ncbi:hypothetical protein DFJ77DRAFT_445320 [Powellomyces hirtus]|nr:hypothetical protein DFJ77DRAFT_445320 [Powellomyces hirtus]
MDSNPSPPSRKSRNAYSYEDCPIDALQDLTIRKGRQTLKKSDPEPHADNRQTRNTVRSLTRKKQIKFKRNKRSATGQGDRKPNVKNVESRYEDVESGLLSTQQELTETTPPDIQNANTTPDQNPAVISTRERIIAASSDLALMQETSETVLLGKESSVPDVLESIPQWKYTAKEVQSSGLSKGSVSRKGAMTCRKAVQRLPKHGKGRYSRLPPGAPPQSQTKPITSEISSKDLGGVSYRCQPLQMQGAELKDPRCAPPFHSYTPCRNVSQLQPTAWTGTSNSLHEGTRSSGQLIRLPPDDCGFSISEWGALIPAASYATSTFGYLRSPDFVDTRQIYSNDATTASASIYFDNEDRHPIQATYLSLPVNSADSSHLHTPFTSAEYQQKKCPLPPQRLLLDHMYGTEARTHSTTEQYGNTADILRATSTHGGNARPSVRRADRRVISEVVELGGLGPNTGSEEHFNKLYKLQKQKQYGAQIRALVTGHSECPHKSRIETHIRPPSQASMVSVSADNDERGGNHHDNHRTSVKVNDGQTKDLEQKPFKQKRLILLRGQNATDKLQQAISKREKMKTYVSTIKKPSCFQPLSRAAEPLRQPASELNVKEYISELEQLEAEHLKAVQEVDGIRREMRM